MGLYLGNKIITPSIVSQGSGGGDTITATNNTGSAISEGDKVFVEKIPGEFRCTNFYLQPFIINGQNYGFGSNLTLTFDDSTGIARGFKEHNYIQLMNFFKPSNNTWEHVYKVKTPSSFQSDNRYLQLAQDSFYTAGMSIEISTAGIFGFGVTSSSTSSWDIGFKWGTHQIPVNTWCWVKLEFTGTQYILSLSEDGKEWTQEAVITSSASIRVASNYITIGGNYYNGIFWGGEVDLGKSYIKINNKTWWTGAYRLSNAESYLTGFAEESIANNSTGSVKTVLPVEISVSVTVDADNATINLE